jgi:NADPH:quinone reductase-like Zn-dependent oxidoreductase
VGFSIGQEIYGMNDWFAEGALAEYCVTQPDWIAPKPQHFSHVDTASVPYRSVDCVARVVRPRETPGP